jgi:D-sedoheptulose 7-phosphate isomerase
MIKKIINKNIKNAINNIRIFNSKKYINQIEKTSILLTNVIKNGNKIFFCGNGGSAADSQHLCGELVSKFLKKESLIQRYL